MGDQTPREGSEPRTLEVFIFKTGTGSDCCKEHSGRVTKTNLFHILCFVHFSFTSFICGITRSCDFDVCQVRMLQLHVRMI